MWEKIKSYVETVFGQEFILTKEAVITNRVNLKKVSVANFVCLITKQYIYRQRCLKEKISFEAIKAQIFTFQCIEKFIAKKNGMLALHNNKWEVSNTQGEG